MTFSRNTVVLKVSGPDIVDLSFVDLPGMPRALPHPFTLT